MTVHTKTTGTPCDGNQSCIFTTSQRTSAGWIAFLLMARAYNTPSSSTLAKSFEIIFAIGERTSTSTAHYSQV